MGNTPGSEPGDWRFETFSPNMELDKTQWGDGPWQHEPDELKWEDEVTGLPCLILRGPSGALCGYVGVRSTHPFWQREYNECPEGRDCPTYTTLRDSQIKWRSEAIRNGETDSFAMKLPVPPPDSWFGRCGHCDCPSETRPDGLLDAHGGITFSGTQEDSGHGEDIWFFGFDCAHSGDLTPGMQAMLDACAREDGYRSWDDKMQQEHGFPSTRGHDVYRDVEYVKGECERLALQMHIMVEAPCGREV